MASLLAWISVRFPSTLSSLSRRKTSPFSISILSYRSVTEQAGCVLPSMVTEPPERTALSVDRWKSMDQS